MRAVVFALSLLAFSISYADLKKADDFYKESETAYQKALKEKTFSKKASYLKDLKKSFETTLKEYEKKNPDEGTDQEQEVSTLYYTLEPAFELSALNKVTEKECDKKELTVRSQAGHGKEEGAKLSARAEEALRWIEVLCK
ncbi:hypothetical protein [Bdellovibrio sp. BCCA]|uniref:hypothetical protein n=1 Tax=Bdellovibrio sp. BCCA TaxID=3136281 RepID=UPI0030F17E34